MTITPSRKIASVQISRPKPPETGATIQPARLALPGIWLGATSAFGLSLPDAMPTAAQMYGPRGVWLDDQRLIVCDSGNHRVLIWSQIPDSDQAPADIVLGQSDFFSEGPQAAAQRDTNSECGLHLPTGVIVANGKLLVADAWHHRILVWNHIPQVSHQPPDYCIGQASLADHLPNRGLEPTLANLNWPYGLAFVRGQLFVTDTGNRRVLVWNRLPNCDCPADFVLGQNHENDRDENRGGPPTAGSFRWAHDMAGDERYLFVADAGNHRVLAWSGALTADRPADFVLGQPDFSTINEWPYGRQSERCLRFPYAIDLCQDVLAVADTANNRILFWRLPLDQACGAAAFDVIGQVDFASNGENGWRTVTHESLCWPYGISFHQGRLAVADSGNNRVMLWDCRSMLASPVS